MSQSIKLEIIDDNVVNATFEIKNFPIHSLALPEVKEAIEDGCEVKYSKIKRTTEEIQADIEACKLRLSELEIELNNN
jgi:DNA recombination-dependent growth factor C